METLMKIVVAHDGSKASDEIFGDLPRAGLPNRLEASVITAADLVIPGVTEPRSLMEVPFNREIADKAAATAERVAERLRGIFPLWKVTAETSLEAPLSAILECARVKRADLIVVGAHGHTGLGRFMGSVSQMVLIHAPCSVRVARRAEAHPAPRILLGTDGSDGAEQALKAVLARNWPIGTEVRLLSVVALPTMVDAGVGIPIGYPPEILQNQKQAAEKVVQAAAERLRAAHLTVTTEAGFDAPKSGLLRVAHEWKADTIFVGARGLGAMRKFLLGSVSMAVAARAEASVEVVRSSMQAS